MYWYVSFNGELAHILYMYIMVDSVPYNNTAWCETYCTLTLLDQENALPQREKLPNHQKRPGELLNLEYRLLENSTLRKE